MSVKLSNMKLYNSCYSIFSSFTQTSLVSATSPKENVTNSMIPLEISHAGTINSSGIIILLFLCLLAYYLVKKLHRIFCRNKIKPTSNHSYLEVSPEKIKKIILLHTKETTPGHFQKVALLPIIIPTGSQYYHPQTPVIRLSLVKVYLYFCEEQTQGRERFSCYLLDIKIDVTEVELPLFNTYRFKINLQLLITICQSAVNGQALPHSILLITPVAKEENKKDLIFLQKVDDLLEKHLTEENYTIKQLNIDMAMSRTSFYNRIKGITGNKPTAYILSFKMKKAQDLLIHTQYNVTEIAFRLGYIDAKYFGKKFKEYYQVCPTKYRKNIIKKSQIPQKEDGREI